MATYTDPTVVAVGKSNRVQPAAVIALIAGIIAVAYGGFVFWQITQAKSEKTKIDENITSLKSQVDTLQPVATALDQLSKQAQGLHTIFDNQLRWETILGKIETRLYKNMTITGLQLNADGTATLAGTTATYTDYAKIYASFTDEQGQKTFSQARPIAITRTESQDGKQSQVIFSFNLILNSDLLKLTASNSNQ